MKNFTNFKVADLSTRNALESNRSDDLVGQQAYMYVNKSTGNDKVDKIEEPNTDNLKDRIRTMEAQDSIVELPELIRMLELASKRNIKFSTYNAQFDIIADEGVLVDIIQYMFCQIPIEMRPEIKFTVGFGMGSLQIQFNEDLDDHANELSFVEDFMRKEKGYLWKVGKTLHLVFHVQNRLMAA